MTPQTGTEKFTQADYLRLPEGYPAQLVHGELVKEPAPTYWHQSVVVALVLRLSAVVDPRRVLVAPCDLFVDEWNVLQPDVLVLAPEDRVSPTSNPRAVPLLVVEVRSPGTEDRDLRVKTPLYLAAGVREVWLVDPVAGTVEVHGGDGPPRRHGPDEAAVSQAVPGFQVSWRDLAS
jgi:Uma2 family endonuclease